MRFQEPDSHGKCSRAYSVTWRTPAILRKKCKRCFKRSTTMAGLRQEPRSRSAFSMLLRRQAVLGPVTYGLRLCTAAMGMSVGPGQPVVRAGTAGDASALHQLFDSYGLKWSEQTVEQELLKPYACILLAHVEGALAGAVIAWEIGDEVQILEVIVREEWRRRGVATALLETLLQSSRAAVAVLEVRADNQPAIALYQRLGFTAVGRRQSYYADGADAMLMQRGNPAI